MVSPPVMSHNQFILQKDIVNPIASFLSQNTDSVPVAKYSASPAGKFEERNG